MPRVKHSVTRRKRRKQIRKLARGYRGAGRLFRPGNERLLKSYWYAYRDRRRKKRDFRRLWITRINAAARQYGLSYSRFMHGLKQAGIEINRKVLADMAVNDGEGFRSLVQEAQAQLDG